MEQTWMLFMQIMLINIVLSGDNAVVIALASRALPQRQRKLAVWWGSFGAVVMRLALTVVAVYMLKIPYLQAAGALLLLYIAVSLLADNAGSKHVKTAVSLAGAIWTIIAADFIMSLDNVLAVAAIASGNLVLIAVGVAMSIPLIVWGSALIMKLLDRYPFLVYIGAAILGYTAGEMIVGDRRIGPFIHETVPVLHGIAPLLGVMIVCAAGLMRRAAAGREKT